MLAAVLLPLLGSASLVPEDDINWASGGLPKCQAALGGLIAKPCDTGKYAGDPASTCCDCTNFSPNADKCPLVTLSIDRCMKCDDLARIHCPLSCPKLCDVNTTALEELWCDITTKTFELNVGLETYNIPLLYVVIGFVAVALCAVAACPQLLYPCKLMCQTIKCLHCCLRCCWPKNRQRQRRTRQRARPERPTRSPSTVTPPTHGTPAPHTRGTDFDEATEEAFLVEIPETMGLHDMILFTSPDGFEHQMRVPGGGNGTRCGPRIKVVMPKRHTATIDSGDGGLDDEGDAEESYTEGTSNPVHTESSAYDSTIQATVQTPRPAPRRP